MRPLLLVLTVIRSTETRSIVRRTLEDVGHRVIEANGYPQAQSLLSNGLIPDLLLIEAALTDRIEEAKLRMFFRHAPATATCLIVESTEAGSDKEVSGFGIRHFLLKPVKRCDLELVIDDLNSPPGPPNCVALPSASSSSSDGSTVEGIGASMSGAVPFVEELGDLGYFLAASSKMLEIVRHVKLIADADVNVLILGESGTGKEVIAHLIHKYSQRARHKFLKMNCAALPADLLESELFGHQKGAFTGAIKDRPGKFEQANHGTLLLDEIGEMSAHMQAKLLHVLQDGQFTRLGGEEVIKADLRVLAATNVQIETALRERAFREDLYYRLSVFTINIPPLRERREEIPFLIEETIRRAPNEIIKNSADIAFSPRLIDAALVYDWPGNLRELRNFITRTIIMRDPDAAVRELESKIETNNRIAGASLVDAPSHRSSMRSMMRDLKDRTEAQIIQEALEIVGWNRRHAAQYLNISYRGLLYKIQQHRITPKLKRETNKASKATR